MSCAREIEILVYCTGHNPRPHRYIRVFRDHIFFLKSEFVTIQFNSVY